VIWLTMAMMETIVVMMMVMIAAIINSGENILG
jgi:hypothetical protein